MSNQDDHPIPEAVKKSLRTMLLRQIQSTPALDMYELELFDWYIKETETLLDEMLSNERAFIQEQVQAGAEDLNDSGIVAVDYYLKRVRYSHIIYMASLLESFLDRSCISLATAIGDHNIPSEFAKYKQELERKINGEVQTFVSKSSSTLDELRNEVKSALEEVLTKTTHAENTADKLKYEFETLVASVVSKTNEAISKLESDSLHLRQSLSTTVDIAISAIPEEFKKYKQELEMKIHLALQEFLRRQAACESNLNQKIDTLQRLAETQRTATSSQHDAAVFRIEKLEEVIGKRTGILGLFK